MSERKRAWWIGDEYIPLELQNPENLLCILFDNGNAGPDVIEMLAEYGFAIFPSAEIERLRAALAAERERCAMSEQEAYDFCKKVYNETGGPTQELRRAYDFYLKNYHDGHPVDAK
jgi:hypothetical protein